MAAAQDTPTTGLAVLHPVHVEVCLRASSTAAPGAVTSVITGLLESSDTPIQAGKLDVSQDEQLAPHVAWAHVDLPDDVPSSGIPPYLAEFHVHVFHLDTEGMTHEEADGEDAVSACAQWTLPSSDMVGLWDSLVLEPGIKARLLHSATTGLLFSSAGVDTSIIAWNRVVLLHGPPGTGKTTLCKALAQKLAVRLNHLFPLAQLLEINAHSLFSKWFSESGKLVQRLFQHIDELLDDPDSLVFVLIDEVESLTAARSSASAGAEPSDAVRVVNALLTQIDRLRSRPNVLVLTTSNVTQAIDAAFVDRADIKQYIGLPGASARYAVLVSCLQELRRVGLLTGTGAAPPAWSDLAPAWCATCDALRPADAGGAGGPTTVEHLDAATPPAWLHRMRQGDLESCTRSTGPAAGHEPCWLWVAAAAWAAHGLSGRALRKLPFQAHSFHVQVAAAVPVEVMAEAVFRAALHEQAAREDLTRDSSTKLKDALAK